MKIFNFYRFTIFILLWLGLISGFATAQLVKNGSFESSDVGVVTNVEGWVLSSIANGATFEIVDDTVQHGQRALKVVVNQVGTNSWDIQVVADSIPIRKGETYIATIWAKVLSSTASAHFTVGNYAYREYGRIHNATINTTWTQYTLQFTIDDDSAWARFPIHFSISGNDSKTIYIDNLRIVNINDRNKPVIVEAEQGVLGSEYSSETEGDVSFIRITTNGTGGNPGSENRVATLQVQFPDSGTYNLFARVRAGSGNYNDDSFFYGNGFGLKNVTTDDDWTMVNGLAAAGFTDSSDWVDEAGGAGSNVWKWVNLTKNSYQGEAGITFYVHPDSLAQIFQIGGREDGLDIDKIAFGRANLFYTVKSLDQQLPGATEKVVPQPPYAGPPLAHKQTKFVGNIYSSAQRQNFEAYWNQVTPENAGKWGSVEPTRDVMNWTELDSAYNLAKRNNFPFVFHVLVWGAQQPSWISTLDSAEQLEEIEEWFQAVANRYPDMEYVQVVNEPLNQPPDGQNNRANYKNALGGNGITGYDWIINAFRMARRIFPQTTKLMINEYSVINNSIRTSQYMRIVRSLQAEGLIDVVGEQAHAFTTYGTSIDLMVRNIDSLGSTGLAVQLTELDIDGPTDNQQLTEYRRIFPRFFQHPKVEGITLWGWRPGLWRNDQGAYLITSSGVERPALEWLRTYLDTVQIVTKVANENQLIVKEFYVSNNYPNPFNPSTKIEFRIPEVSKVTINLYNVLGQLIQQYDAGTLASGAYSYTLNGSNLSSGMYFLQVQAVGQEKNYSKTIKVTLMK